MYVAVLYKSYNKLHLGEQFSIFEDCAMSVSVQGIFNNFFAGDEQKPKFATAHLMNSQ